MFLFQCYNKFDRLAWYLLLQMEGKWMRQAKGDQIKKTVVLKENSKTSSG